MFNYIKKYVMVFLLIHCLSGNAYEFFVKIPNLDIKIQRTEVSNREYCEFLNSNLRVADQLCLWNPLMESHPWGGIIRVKNETGFTYVCKSGYEDLPVTCVTWKSAARYCNWLSYGKLPNCTEGDAQYGVYDTGKFDTPEFISDTNAVKRNTSKSFFLPTEAEWMSAAYLPGQRYPFAVDADVISQNKSNYYHGKWAVPFPHLAKVSDFAAFQSHSGTINQAGNVAEWVENRRGNFFLALGGSLIRGEYSVKRDYREGDEADKAISSFGFRPASALTPVILPVMAQNITESGGKKSQSAADKFVTVADPGNPGDQLYNKGRVDYVFEISRFAVTNQEYCEFLNAVAFKADPHLLYNENMSDGLGGGIIRSENEMGFVYQVKPGWEHYPVAYIGYHDAMRYCNWLHYGKPTDGNPGNTEGTDEIGAYDTSFCDLVLSGKPQKKYGKRNAGARYWIPSDDEWYKAAYYDPTRLGARKYWDYPSRSCSIPGNKPEYKNSGNFLKDGVLLGAGGPYFFAAVDQYPGSDSYYGCRQMGGNVWEWVEPNDSLTALNLRGGSWGYTEFGMGAWNCDVAGFSDELNVFGLRIAKSYDENGFVPPSENQLAVFFETIKYFSVKRLFLGMLTIFVCGVLFGIILFFVSRTILKKLK